jgi:hypothetical protein
MVALDDDAVAVQPQDPGRTLEGAEHDDDPAVLLEVGNRLDAAPTDIQPRDFPGAQDAQGIIRDLLTSPRRSAARGDEEHGCCAPGRFIVS